MSDIFGSIFGSAMKGIAGQLETAALPAILSQVLGKTNLGSVGGLLQQLQQSGLGPQVASWLGNGANMPVSVDQLRAGARRPAPAPARDAARHSGRPVARPVCPASAGRRRSHEPERHAGRAARPGPLEHRSSTCRS